MKPICVPCQRFYRPEKNGFCFMEQMPIARDALPGLAKPESWVPYKLWRGDLWQCPDCGHQLISGVAFSPIAEHYQPGFEQAVNETGIPLLKINDC